MSTTINNAMATTGTGGALAVTVSTKDGNGIVAGDLIVANCTSNGTHATNGMTIQDSVNLTNFTHGKEQQQGATTTWQQCDYYQAVANVPDGSTITLTPYSGATVTGISVTVIRYVTGAIANAFVSQSNTANTNQAAPALGAAPVLGSFVMTFDVAASGTLTPGAAFTADSAVVGASISLANAYATADGVSTFASTWSDTASATSTTMTVAFVFAGVGVPYKMGGSSVANGAAAAQVVTTSTSASQPNDALFVIAGTGGSVAPSTVADSKSHTYTLAGSIAAPSGMSLWLYYSLHASAMTTSDTVTVTWNGTTAARNVIVMGCAGVGTSNALDQVATAYGSGNAPSVMTANSLINNNELVIGATTTGYLSGSVTWNSPTTLIDTERASSSAYTSVGAQVVSTSTNPVTVSNKLGASVIWGALIATFVPDPPTGAASTITITNASPLPAGTVGTAYTNQMNATGGAAPYTWSVTAGALPAGLQLSPGGPTGNSDFQYIGVNTGPQGAPTLAQFNACKSALGPFGCYKFFFPTVPSTWVGTLMDQISTSVPGIFCYISWGTVTSAATIKNFILSIPTNIAAVGFTFESEPEHSMSASTYVNGFMNQAAAIKAVQPQTPVQLVMMTAAYTDFYQTGGGNSYIPPPSTTTQAGVDVYGMDFYDRHGHWAGNDMGSTTAWINWTNHVKGFGKPIALTEYGISGATAADQNTRLQADWNYLKSAFGPGGSISQLPLYSWLYWNTNGLSFTTVTGDITQMLSAPMQQTWKGIAGTQSGVPTASGTGGLISGTPTTAQTTTPTIRATDTANAFGSKAFSITIASAGALTITTASLPGGTIGTAYTGGQLTASGGTAPYTWSLQSGVLPNGLAIVGQAITGTPTANGTFSFVIQVTDNVAATATANLSITIASGLVVVTTSLPAGQVGIPYAFTLVEANGTPPFSWGITNDLPAGLSLDPVGGVISGTPQVAGSFPETFTLTDAAGATTTSVPMTLAIAAFTGGLPPLGRRRFGGTTGDWVFSFAGDTVDRAAGVAVTFYTALTGGTQITDLTTIGGGPITSVTTDSAGEIPEFYGPDSVIEMFADANGGLGPRRRIEAADMGEAVSLLWTAVRNLGG